MKSGNGFVLKVCKIDSLGLANYCIAQGVHFLGVHILESEDIGRHEELIRFIQERGGRVIVVTKIKSLSKIDALLNNYKPSGLQLHFDADAGFVQSIKRANPTLLLFGVVTSDSRGMSPEEYESNFDYVIYDKSYKGGTGTVHNYDLLHSFPTTLKAKTLLAGGLSVEQIIKLKKLSVRGFDMQSYFRSEFGINYRRVEQICDQIVYPRRGKLSISLTDISLVRLQEIFSYYFSGAIEFHLDYSDGSLYAHFNTLNRSIPEKQQFLRQLPYSLHVFVKGEDNIVSLIRKIVLKHPQSLIRVFVQYYPGLSPGVFSDPEIGVKIIPSVYHRDLGQFLSEFSHVPFLSIIVPDAKNKENLEEFVNVFLKHYERLKGAEIWLDRNLESEYIKQLKSDLRVDFNVIVGKGLFANWNQTKNLNEFFSEEDRS